uniref:UDP-glycosyltransferase 1 n=1 Tax=Linum usitatissimum TaxID=4006 RepID=I2BHD0_LINUS|nr:UDP-glycosyltransferase 1 [Linum usitatissimum]
MSITTTIAVSGAHVLVYPYPAAGHIIPILDLTHYLLSRGLTVTLLLIPCNLNLLHSFRLSHQTTQLNELILPAPDPSPPGPTLPIGPIVNMKYFRAHHYPLLLQQFKSHPWTINPPTAIIADFFLGWTNQLASEMSIRHVLFSPSGAFGISVATSLWRDEPPFPINDQEIITFPTVPNSPSYPWRQISFIYRMLQKGNPDREIFRDCFLANLSSWGTVINTFARIEKPYIDHLKRESSSHGRVWAVGPLLRPPSSGGGGGNSDRGGASSIPSDQIITWLDSRSERSVVYICFGSRTSLTEEQLKRLSAALEKRTGVSFVWCVRQSTEAGSALLPEEFDTRVSGRGLVIRGWAPQVEILRHKAVGAFLTHCGWNSTMEGLTAGVVMLTWPMGADQYSNAQLLVDQLRVGIRVGEDTEVIPDEKELGRVLEEAVAKGGMWWKRERAKELRTAARDAVVEGGSSFKDLDEFVEKINGKTTNSVLHRD